MNEEAEGPPRNELKSSGELGRRNYSNTRSYSYTKKPINEKISEEMARLFLD